jgi:GT2 family glycosyltransferase
MNEADGRGRSALPRPVTVVIVTWNGLDHTRRCLASLLPTIAALPVEVVVVDNASTDGTAEWLRQTSGVRCLLQTRNGGFSAGANAGIDAASAESDIVLLNNDVLLESDDWLTRLAELAYRQPRVGIVSARLHYPDARLQDAGTELVFDPFTVRRFGVFEVDVGQYGSARPVPAVSFACVYIRRAAIECIGALDADRYFCYFEDIDYCLRTWEAGFSIWCAGEVRVAHVEHASSGDAAPQLTRRSELQFTSRWSALRTHDVRRTVVLRLPEGADWERREVLRRLAFGLAARGWRVTPRRVQRDRTELPCEALSPDCRLDDLWRVAAARPCEHAVAGIDIAAHGRDLRVHTNDREETWTLGDPLSGGAIGVPSFSLAADRDYFRPRARGERDGMRWLAILAGANAEHAWSLLCALSRELGLAGCVRMEKLPVPYDLQWSKGPIVVHGGDGRLEVRRHCWADAATRAQLYAQVDACLLVAGGTDVGLAALELAALGVPIAAAADDLPRELRRDDCAALLPSGAAFGPVLRARLAAWTDDPAAARCVGYRAALALSSRSWSQTLDRMSERLDALVA